MGWKCKVGHLNISNGWCCPECVKANEAEKEALETKLDAAKEFAAKTLEWYGLHMKRPEDEQSKHPIAILAKEFLNSLEPK